VSVKRTYLHSRQWFNTLIQRSRTVGSVAYTVFFSSRLSAPMELSTRYTTPDTTVVCDRGIISLIPLLTTSEALDDSDFGKVARGMETVGITCDVDVCRCAADTPSWSVIVLSLSVALASLIIVVAVVILAFLCLCPACRHRRSSQQQQQQQQQQASRRSSLPSVDMPPPYPGPFIPGQITDLVSPLPEPITTPTAPDDRIWFLDMDDISGADEARGGDDVVEKKWPIDDDDEGHFVPDAVEMNAKLEEAIPPPPHFNYDQRQHHHLDRYRHHRHQQQVQQPQQQCQLEDNNYFVPADTIRDRPTAAARCHRLSSASSSTPVSAAPRRQTSTGGSDSVTDTSLSACSSSATGGGFTSSSSSRRLSPPSFYLASTASSSLSSQSRLVLSDDPDTTQTDVDYY